MFDLTDKLSRCCGTGNEFFNEILPV